jgi:hypothetical protein
MAHLFIKFRGLLCVIDWMTKNQIEIPHNLWNAFFETSFMLSLLKNKRPKTATLPLHVNEPLEFTYQRSRNGIGSLPTEILLKIFEQLRQKQGQLFKLLFLNKMFYSIVHPYLYEQPILSSPNAVKFISNNLLSGSRFSRVIQFSPCLSGSLNKTAFTTCDLRVILEAHSCLFQLLVIERDMSDSFAVLPAPNRLFYALARSFPNLKRMEEVNIVAINRTALENSSRELLAELIPPISTNLTNLLKSCQKWIKEFPEWEGLKDDIGDAMDTCVFLLEQYEGQFRPIWYPLGSDIVRSTKQAVMSQCKSVLNSASTSLLLQVRFITSSSQRLLDSYCLIYYGALRISQTLDVDALIDCFSMQSDDPNTPQYISQMNSLACTKIYEALAMLFRHDINNQAAETPTRVSILREALITFPPTSMNDETSELLGIMIDMELDPFDYQYHMLEKWLSWLKVVHKWYQASRQMDAVKQLLRKSMSKIDHLRGLQVTPNNLAKIWIGFYGYIKL